MGGVTQAESGHVPPLPPPAPYGSRSLADLVPSVFSAIGLHGFRNPLHIEPLDAACVLVIDGLGQRQVVLQPDAAPFLSALAKANDPLVAGFPASTATSLGSLATGLPPGEHGFVGYTVEVPGQPRPMNLLLWELYGHGPDAVPPLIDQLPPEEFQPAPTLLEGAAEQGVRVIVAGPPDHAHSALTRAILRGCRYQGAGTLGELVLTVRAALADRQPIYAYNPALDYHGHMHGTGSDRWLEELAQVDAAAAAIADGLPADAALIVTGDHGMVEVPPDQRIDLADEPELAAGVRFLAGEGRARHIVPVPGAARDVMAIWSEVVGDRMWVLSREEAIATGWFGPTVTDETRRRIGEVVAVAFEPVAVVQRDVDPLQAMLTGHHGSLTDAERLVPFAFVRA
jgi:hypothetical protein